MADAKHLYINPGFGINATQTFTQHPLDATTDQAEWIFYAERAGTITQLGFRYGVRTGTPPTYKIGLQGVDASTGFPDGTIKGGGSPASVTFTPPADATWDGTWRKLTLDNSYTNTQGEGLAIVIAYSSGTVDGSNFSSVTIVDSIAWATGNQGFPLAIANNAGARTKNANRAVFAYYTAGNVFGFPAKTAYTATLTNTLEAAARWILPAGWGTSYQVEGCRMLGIASATGKNPLVRLYSGTTVLQTVTIDTDVLNAAALRVFEVRFPDNPLATLSFGTEYRLGIQYNDAAGNWIFRGMTLDSNADFDAYPLGTDWYLSTRTSAGAWTDDNTSRLFLELLIRDLTPPSATGIKVNSGMQGGLRG